MNGPTGFWVIRGSMSDRRLKLASVLAHFQWAGTFLWVVTVGRSTALALACGLSEATLGLGVDLGAERAA